MDAATQAWLDQEDARVTDIVRRYGWFIQYVGGGLCTYPGCECGETDRPPFGYTVGLFGLGHPELLILGVDPNTAGRVLNDLGERVRSGATLMVGQMITFDWWANRIVPEQVPNPGDIVYSANRFYDRPPEVSVPVLQLSYDDGEGRFPWEESYAVADKQPRPGTFTAW